MEIKAIGIIKSQLKDTNNLPIQPFQSKHKGSVVVFKKYKAGLKDLGGFSHIILFYRFHKAKGYRLRVKPFLDNVIRGVFATRYPCRPNRIGLSVVKLLKVRGRTLYVQGVDVLDGTPLLDIKPFVPDFEPKKHVKIGWLSGKIYQDLLS